MTDSSKQPRGRSYPGHSLEEAIAMLTVVQLSLGDGPFSRAAVAESFGQTLSGPAMVKIGALSHFGLIIQKGGSTSLSDLGRSILFPRSEEERSESLAHAAKSPSLYADLFERFGGKSLPNLLPNILTREFGVLAKVAERCARIFIDTVTFAQLYRHGVLHQTPQPKQQQTVNGGEDHPHTRGDVGTPRETDRVGGRSVPIHSDERVFTMPLTGRRMVSLTVPPSLSMADVKMIRRWLGLMEEALVEDEFAFDEGAIEQDEEVDLPRSPR